MKTPTRFILSILFSFGALFCLVACGPTISQIKPQQTVTINATFQSQVSPIPTAPPYRCGAWASNNAPDAFATITIYARLTKNIQGVPGAMATAVVHFQGGDQQLAQQPVSDQGGYVSFPLPLEGQQPRQVPATVSVTFSGIAGGPGTLECTQAFFTPK